MDSIVIENLTFDCIIGLLSEERETLQPLSVSMIAQFDCYKAAQTEVLTDTLDYYALSQGIKQIATDGKFHLLERLAEVLAGYVLSQPGVLSVQITVKKPQAIPDAAYVAVRLERTHANKATQHQSPQVIAVIN